jgi:hypothetical protein
MFISPNELSFFDQDSITQILNSDSVLVCELPLNNGFKLNLYSVSNYFIEELVNRNGYVLELKPVNSNYVASLYCKQFSLNRQII